MSKKAEFQIRWSDIDSNQHVANVSYAKLVTDARVILISEYGAGKIFFQNKKTAPIILRETFDYIKEVRPNDKVKVSLELEGRSEDYRFFLWSQSIYNSKGYECVRVKVLGTMIDMKERKIASLDPLYYPVLEELPKSPDYKILKKKDLQKHKVEPRNLQS